LRLARDSAKLNNARKESVQQPYLYQQIIEEYKDRQLPQLDKLSRELHLNPKYGILQDAAESAAKVFLESVNHVEITNSNGYIILESNFVEEDKITVEDNISDLQHEDTIDNKLKDNQYKQNHQSRERSIYTNTNSLSNHIHLEESLEKYEIRLINQEKAYIYVPVPLPFGEKERLKKYIDLILEDLPANSKVSNSSFCENLEQKTLWD
jgi:hypothetical protein